MSILDFATHELTEIEVNIEARICKSQARLLLSRVVVLKPDDEKAATALAALGEGL